VSNRVGNPDAVVQQDVDSRLTRHAHATLREHKAALQRCDASVFANAPPSILKLSTREADLSSDLFDVAAPVMSEVFKWHARPSSEALLLA